jgi:16S rRNA A1518/A1519 N6-dimethyltransferase RsmA/KsgA/DIM1 with predicted DNA glycosylase/AP lyase activity
MFLDDQIVELVLKNKPKNDEEHKELVQQIVKLCFHQLEQYLMNNMSNENIIPSMKRTCNMWNSAVRKLQTVNYPLLVEDGFEKLIFNKPDLKSLLLKAGYKFKVK